MTTVTSTRSLTADAPSPLGRVIAVTRLHFVNRFSIFVMPWLILAIIFLANYIVWWTILSAVPTEADRADVREGLSYSGGAFFIFVYMMVVVIQAISVTFTVALGFSATRREFSLGTLVAFVILAALYGAGFTLLSYVEQATGGWGLGGSFFATTYFAVDGGPVLRFLLMFAVFAFFFAAGSAFAVVFVRWKANGVTLFSAILGLVLVGLAALVTLTGSWPTVGDWFGVNGPTGVIAWSLVPTVIATLAAALLLRRATPTG